jgi:hypothetical protein
MHCHHDTAGHALGSHRDLWAEVSAANGLAFAALLELISWQGPAAPEPADDPACCTLCRA